MGISSMLSRPACCNVDDVTELGAVLAGDAEGRRSADESTVFDSTGLAIQDLAVALAAFEQVDRLETLQEIKL